MNINNQSGSKLTRPSLPRRPNLPSRKKSHAVKPLALAISTSVNFQDAKATKQELSAIYEEFKTKQINIRQVKDRITTFGNFVHKNLFSQNSEEFISNWNHEFTNPQKDSKHNGLELLFDLLSIKSTRQDRLQVVQTYRIVLEIIHDLLAESELLDCLLDICRVATITQKYVKHNIK